MCNCQNWCRVPGGEGYASSLPVSEHHPGCEDYKLERFTRITYSTGASCIVEASDVGLNDIVVDDGDEWPIVEPCWMTRDQYDKLEEFDGP